MKSHRLIVILAASLAVIPLAGCAAPTWVKYGVTAQEQLRERYECERDSEMVGAMPTGPYGGLVLASAQLGYIARKNEMKRMCMRSKGYVTVEEIGTQPAAEMAPPVELVAPPPVTRPVYAPPPAGPHRMTLEEQTREVERIKCAQMPALCR